MVTNFVTIKDLYFKATTDLDYSEEIRGLKSNWRICHNFLFFNMKGIILAICLTILCFCFGFGAGLKCYQCDYIGGEKPANQSCNAEKIGSEYLKDCDAVKTHCMTVIGSKNVSNVVVPAVKRDCAPVEYNKTMDCNTTTKGYPGFEMAPAPKICICSTEGCNTQMHNNTAPAIAIGLAYFSLPLLGLAFGQMSTTML